MAAAVRYVPYTCPTPVCNNDPILCPGYMICPDTELPQVTAVENFTTYYFTAEYGLRLLTVWAVTPRVAGEILPCYSLIVIAIPYNQPTTPPINQCC